MEQSYSEPKSSSYSIFLLDLLLPQSSCRGNSNGLHFFLKLFIGFCCLLFSRFKFGEIFKLWRHENKSQDSDNSCSQERRLDENNNDKDNISISSKEVEMIMERLGLFCNEESEGLKETMNSDELSELFDEKEPSLEEVKEAFDAFDKNGDGFIDAEELQSVLQMLGLKEGTTVERCKQMIHKFDDNGDGRIDFNEFVRFMEASFC